MLNIAIAGLGTVGAAVVRQLRQNTEMLAARAGQEIVLKAVSARDKNRTRDCDLSGVAWVDDPRGLAALPGLDVVVELMGGAEGAARDLAEAALASGKHYVTANKALIAAHGPALAVLAESTKTRLSFEASVAGGIPVIKAMRESLSGDTVESVCGILNGTCNYILTRMRDSQMDFATALAEAQQKGYAEADPAADIDGHDTANKLAILAALGFGLKPDIAAIRVEGIRNVTPCDLDFAQELGCRIKLLGIARAVEGGIEQKVGPSLVPEKSPLAAVDGVFNSILLKGRQVGPVMLEGYGAGGAPTANAVVADIVDIARGSKAWAFSVPAARLKSCKPGKSLPTRYYMRLQVADQPGVVADVAAIMRDEGLSFESLLQRGRSQSSSIPVIITTHKGDSGAMRRAAEKIARVPAVKEPPCLMPIEDQ